ncbi:hypothetical protein WSS_A00175 [Rhodococcus opacus M213]|uniref:DUF202 domain-containing protein n=2 Tax=Rhodococcus opacus TaxID=37919 RepID=K8XV48_RHOOP|nr:DUF202 domain-containing protein [Rhodococcus opacus]ANS31154.1 Conserved putative membrane protein [Rhodococcus opacus]EKT84801.1 hypothetical protein WSS_A00175 [Rhodococcus opacus M213]
MSAERSGPVTAWKLAALRAGTDPDPRFSLANERTFLAWIRTALGIIAAAIALETLSGDLLPDGPRQLFVCILLGFAALLVVSASRRWFRIEVAMRMGQSLPLPGTAAVTAGLVAVAATALLTVVLT